MRQTPLAGPVVPDVKTINAVSPPSATTGQKADAACRLIISSVHVIEERGPAPSPKKTTCVTHLHCCVGTSLCIVEGSEGKSSQADHN